MKPYSQGFVVPKRRRKVKPPVDPVSPPSGKGDYAVPTPERHGLRCPGCGKRCAKAVKTIPGDDKDYRIRKCHGCERHFRTVESIVSNWVWKDSATP